MRPTERNVATLVRRAGRAAVRARRRELVETMKQTLAAVEAELLGESNGTESTGKDASERKGQ